MKNFKYRKLVAGVLAAAGLAGGLSWGANRLAAEDISAAATLKVPSLADAAKWTVSYDEQAPQAPGIGMKSGRVIKKTNFYNKKGRKIKKSVLKKGKKLTVVGSQKIRGKKFYLVIQGKFVPANCIKIKKVRVQKPAATPVKQAEPKKAKATIADFSLSEFRQEFLKVLNDERTKRGLTPVTADTHYDEVTQERTKLLPANFSHNGKSGNFILEDYYKQAGISFNGLGECIAMFPWGWTVDHKTNELTAAKNPSSALIADNMLYEYIYNDAASNWGHRDILLNPQDKTIGLGAVVVAGKGQVYSAVGATY